MIYISFFGSFYSISFDDTVILDLISFFRPYVYRSTLLLLTFFTPPKNYFENLIKVNVSKINIFGLIVSFIRHIHTKHFENRNMYCSSLHSLVKYVVFVKYIKNDISQCVVAALNVFI